MRMIKYGGFTRKRLQMNDQRRAAPPEHAARHRVHKDRIAGLDLAKSLAIFLVIFIHYIFYTGFVDDTALNNLASTFSVVGVPLFFAVNGYLLMNSRFSADKHLHKILRMVFILLAWKIISLPILSALMHKSIDWKSVPQYLLGGSYDVVPLGYFWFINALLAIYIVFPILKTVYDDPDGKRYLGYVTIVLGALIFAVTLGDNAKDILASYCGHQVPQVLASLSQYNILGGYGYALVYFIAGGYGHDMAAWLSRHLSSTRTKNICLSLMALLAWGLLFTLQRFQARAKGISFYVDSGYQNVLTLILTIALFQLFIQVRKVPSGLNTIVTAIGSNTLGIYYLHLMLILVTRDLVLHFHLFYKAPMLINLVLVAAIVLIATFISWVGGKIPFFRHLFIG
ncbi:hypothetical protein DKK74_01045 [Bifidobacterium asteroides]|uniref:Acyltransferase 3 domain-containing protein n=2 Tax=Bifidobacterium asteroides TaxID=1684 RepID=A0A318MT53_9BIFI|nr:hypothetical protein DKK74_01045 [Bifidobacterium asteroides]